MEKNEILNITKDLPDVIAIAPNAFSRVVASEFFPNYSIVCFKNRGETDYVSNDIEVFCVEKENPKVKISKMNAAEMLKLPEVQNYINSKRDPHLMVYKPTRGLETIANETGWKFIANSSSVKYDIENKYAFRGLIQKAGIDVVIGESVKYDDLNDDLYNSMVEKYGTKLVFQVCEITVGGGTGTAFINSVDDFRSFKDKFDIKREKLSSIENVNITKFMEGIPTSISACATRNGTLTGFIQTQILDVPEVRTMSEGSGLFSGHDFSYGDFNDDLNYQAKEIAKKFGDYIYKNLGYKGIFGLDLITNKEEGKVYVIECNPRFTDAFPLVSEIYNKQGAIPMDVFHILEHLNVDYQINVDEVSQTYRVNNPASQIILETKIDDWTVVSGDLKAGVYKINHQDSDGEAVSYQRPGYRFEQLNSDDEFLVTEGVPFKDTKLKEGARILRLIFAKSILESPKNLTDEAKRVIADIYKKLGIEKVDQEIFLKNFIGLNICEIPDERFLPKAENLGAELVNLNQIDSKFGYVRPEKIMWGMELTDDVPLKQVRAKRLRKHLNNWMKNMNKFNLRYEVKDEISNNEYVLWFEKYRSLLSAKDKANIKINPLWLTYKHQVGKNVGGIFIYQCDNFLGGNVFTTTEKNFTVCYGAVERIKNPNWSLGALVDYLCIINAKERGYQKIGFGQDNNLYGYHLSTGLLEYKLNLGLTPHYKQDAKIYSTKFINLDKFQENIVFLGIVEGRDVFYKIKKSSSNEAVSLNTDLEVIEVNL